MVYTGNRVATCIMNAQNIKAGTRAFHWYLNWKLRTMCTHACIHTTQTQTCTTTTTTTQLNEKPWRRPLTMGHQQSEMTAQYTGEPETISRVIPHSGNPQPPTLADHFVNGPTKVKLSCIFTARLYHFTNIVDAILNYCIKLISLCIHGPSILHCTPPLCIQELTPSTVNRSVQGRRFVPQHQAVLDRNEPYMTTNNW